MPIETFTFAGSNFANVHIDTYQMLNGDSVDESFLQNQAEELGLPSDYDAYDWSYDHSGIVAAFAEESANAIVAGQGGEVIKSIKVTSSGSPREYNFTSDWWEGDFEIDTDALDAWCAQTAWATEDGFDADAYAEKYHGSRDGFMSHMQGRLAGENRAEWVAFCKVDAYLRETLDREEYDGWLYEAEAEVYSEHTTATLKDKPHVWQHGWLTGVMTCEKCGLMPLDADDMDPDAVCPQTKVRPSSDDPTLF